MPNSSESRLRHFVGGGPDRYREQVRIPRDILRHIEHCIQALREREQVLLIDGGGEGDSKLLRQLAPLHVRGVLSLSQRPGLRTITGGPGRECLHTFDGDGGLTVQRAKDIRGLWQKPMSCHIVAFPSRQVSPANRAQAGIVITQAASMSRTMRQPTCRTRRSDPAPTTDEATT